MKKLYYAIAQFDYVSEKLGPESPAKVAVLEKARKAARQAAINALTDVVQNSETLADVLEGLNQASKGSSELPALLKDARTDDTIKSVLEKLR